MVDLAAAEGGGMDQEQVPLGRIRQATAPAKFVDRAGFDPQFLAAEVPLPTFTSAVAADIVDLSGVVGADSPWLHYCHFSLAMSKERRFARVTAVNISVLQRPPSGTLDRPGSWYLDGRLPDDQQVGENAHLYGEKYEYGFDRGHLVRREDPIWGDATAAATANRDTHHFTNCTPQHCDFNQDNQSWRAVEEYVAEQLAEDNDRISVFTGPVLREDDPVYEKIAVPLEFWKVIATATSTDRPVAIAFRFSQEDRLRGLVEAEKVNWLERIAAQQRTVASIERLCDIDFGHLRDHDTRRRRALDEGLDPAELPPIPLRSLDDIVL
jgi:endonuclease G